MNKRIKSNKYIKRFMNNNHLNKRKMEIEDKELDNTLIGSYSKSMKFRAIISMAIGNILMR